MSQTCEHAFRLKCNVLLTPLQHSTGKPTPTPLPPPSSIAFRTTTRTRNSLGIYVNVISRAQHRPTRRHKSNPDQVCPNTQTGRRTFSRGPLWRKVPKSSVQTCQPHRGSVRDIDTTHLHRFSQRLIPTRRKVMGWALSGGLVASHYQSEASNVIGEFRDAHADFVRLSEIANRITPCVGWLDTHSA